MEEGEKLEWKWPLTLRTDITELSDETEDHVVLLIDWSLANLVAKLVDFEVFDIGALQVTFGYFRKFGEGKKNRDRNTGAWHRKIDVLDVCKIVGISSGKEELGSNLWKELDEAGQVARRLLTKGPMKEATPFHAWQNWRREEADAGSPMTTAYLRVVSQSRSSVSSS